MKKLPTRPNVTNRLSLWVSEWEIEKKLRAMSGFKPADKVPMGSPKGQPLEEVKIGEVRLMAPHLSPEGQRSLHVLVVANWTDDWKLIIPFSPFSTPATDKELRTKLEDPNFSVLQVWNARTMPSSVIAESWTAFNVEDELLDEAYAAFQCATFGAAIPLKLESRIGTPINQANDPRLEYQREEICMLPSML